MSLCTTATFLRSVAILCAAVLLSACARTPGPVQETIPLDPTRAKLQFIATGVPITVVFYTGPDGVAPQKYKPVGRVFDDTGLQDMGGAITALSRTLDNGRNLVRRELVVDADQPVNVRAYSRVAYLDKQTSIPHKTCSPPVKRLVPKANTTYLFEMLISPNQGICTVRSYELNAAGERIALDPPLEFNPAPVDDSPAKQRQLAITTIGVGRACAAHKPEAHYAVENLLNKPDSGISREEKVAIRRVLTMPVYEAEIQNAQQAAERDLVFEKMCPHFAP